MSVFIKRAYLVEINLGAACQNPDPRLLLEHLHIIAKRILDQNRRPMKEQ